MVLLQDQKGTSKLIGKRTNAYSVAFHACINVCFFFVFFSLHHWFPCHQKTNTTGEGALCAVCNHMKSSPDSNFKPHLLLLTLHIIPARRLCIEQHQNASYNP